MTTAVTDIQETSVKPSGGRVVVLWDGGVVSRTLPPEGSLVVGRSTSCDLQVDHKGVSRRHLRVSWGHRGASDERHLTVEDLGSSNGSKLRGASLAGSTSVPLAFGDVVEVGREVILVVQGPGVPRLGVAARAPEPDQETPDVAPPLDPPEGVVAESPAMRAVFRQAHLVARGDIPVLICGETGTGKEVLADAIHRASSRAARPLVKFNCAAVPEALVESELFGHVRGAFSGAERDRDGLFIAADGGTLMLDEVGELSPAVQAKLLRALDAREVMRVGETRPRPVDVRVLSATHRGLEQMVTAGAFRQDLWFRINGFRLDLPPLRARPEDIDPLLKLFLAEAEARLTDAARVALHRHRWPGNVRELHHVCARARLLAGDGPVSTDHLQLTGARPHDDPRVSSPAPGAADTSLGGDLRELERQRIVDALAATGGNQTQAARRLGMPRRTFVSRLDAYGLPRPRKGRRGAT